MPQIYWYVRNYGKGFWVVCMTKNDPMNRNVFISHSSEDAEIAQKVTAYLEENGIQCWMAPRDIRPGYNYDEEIMDGIENTSSMIVLLSSNSNDSDHVKREIELAANQKHTIFPIRLEEIEPSKKLKYYIIGKQWLDIFNSPFYEKMAQLVNSFRGQPDFHSSDIDLITASTHENKKTEEYYDDIVSEVLELLRSGNLLVRSNTVNKEEQAVFYNLKDVIMEIFHKNLYKTKQLSYQRIPYLKRCNKCKTKADALYQLDPTLSWAYHLSMLPKCDNDIEDINRSTIEQVIIWGGEQFSFQIPIDRTNKWGLDISILNIKQWIPEKDFSAEKIKIKYSFYQIIEKLKALAPLLNRHLLTSEQ
jgi:hypothetical protein